jgi:hypothetical protein
LVWSAEQLHNLRGRTVGKETIISFTDDVTGKPIERTEASEVQIIVGGFLYTLDLGEASIAKYVRPLIEKAPAKRRFSGASSNVVPMVRQAPASRGSSDFVTRVAEADKRKAVRAWWLRNQANGGLPTYSDRGRIPNEVTASYERMGGKDFAPPVKETKVPVKETPKLTEALRSKTVAAPEFSSPEPESKSARAKVPASRGKAPAKVTTPAASRARGRSAKA